MFVRGRGSENSFFEARAGGNRRDCQSLDGGRVCSEEEGVGEGCGEQYGVFVGGGGWWTGGGFGDGDDETVEGLFVGARDDLEVYGSGDVVS